MSQQTDQLATSIKYDVDRLANLKELEEHGFERVPDSSVTMVLVHRRLKGGHERTHIAVRESHQWRYWWQGCGSQTVLGPWDHFVASVVNRDNPIITAVEYHGATTGKVFNAGQQRNEED